MTMAAASGKKQHPRTVAQDASADRSFLLSRIYAKGWNASKAMSADRLLDLDAEKIAALNPYALEDERQRWAEGFAGGAKK
jgi:hypothetical protein